MRRVAIEQVLDADCERRVAQARVLHLNVPGAVRADAPPHAALLAAFEAQIELVVAVLERLCERRRPCAEAPVDRRIVPPARNDIGAVVVAGEAERLVAGRDLVRADVRSVRGERETAERGRGPAPAEGNVAARRAQAAEVMGRAL